LRLEVEAVGGVGTGEDKATKGSVFAKKNGSTFYTFYFEFKEYIAKTWIDILYVCRW